MDLKGISWIGDMYNRFESMCVEVDEIMYQDTVKYVENQMQTVGESVKRFYSDVMQDLLPPSSLDTVKEHSPIVEKTNVENGGHLVNSITEQMMKDSDGLANGISTINHWTSSPVCNMKKPPYEPTFRKSVEEQCAGKNLESQCAEKNLSSLHGYLPKDLDDQQDPEQNCPDIATLNTDAKRDPGEELSCSEVFSEIDEALSELRGNSSKLTSVLEVNQSKEDGVGILEDVTDGSADAAKKSKTTIPSSRDISANVNEASGASISSEIENVDADNHGVLDSKQFDMMKLGESCVLVEKSEHSFKLPLSDEQKSYKKKIRDVFSPRRWSKGKRDQEQLAVWYEEQTGNKLIPTSLKHAGVSDSPQNEPLELEWELL
uniref:Uncharacterized protein n=1 Tax=Opuntia streptacantha TaxID=393608 RepID=A0A7C8ZVA9_OPUST